MGSRALHDQARRSRQRDQLDLVPIKNLITAECMLVRTNINGMR
jgi:hypothetical protein